MVNLLQDTEKQLTEISNKLNDSEYLDGLSPEAIDELKAKFQMLSEELNRYQNQYYQVLNQANMRIIQTVSNSINQASEKVAKDKKLAMIVNKEACFFFNSHLDITPAVIAEMDRVFDQEAKKAAVTQTAVPTGQTAQVAPAQTGAPAEAKK
jgi:outer membrane protein